MLKAHASTQSPSSKIRPVSDVIRYIVVLTASSVGLFFSLLFTAWQLAGVEKLDPVRMSVEIVSMGLLAFNIVYLLIRRSIVFASTLLLCFAVPFFYYLFFTGGVDGSGMLWSMIIPVFSFFLLGMRRGLILSGSYLGATVVFHVLQYAGVVSQTYSLTLMIRFYGVYIFSILTAFFYERVQQTALNNVKEKLNKSRELEAELVRAKEHAELLTDIVPSAIFTVDTETRVTSFNKKAEEITGFSAAEVLLNKCKLWTELPCKSSCGLFTKGLHGPIRDVKCTIRQKDGQIRTVLKNAKLLYGADGKIAGGVESFVDITELDQAHNAALEARQEAERANTAKSTFLANMSHEIRTPMNGILGLSSILLETGLTAEQKEYVKSVQDSGEALLTLINDILDFSKIEAGKYDLDDIPFDLRATVEGAVEIVAFRAAEKGLDLSLLIHADVPLFLTGDPGRLRQIIINLINNAVKFTETGEVSLVVKKEKVTDTEAVLRFEITDTGIGISPQDQKKLFHSFSQVDTSITRNFGGTGLGLAISKRLSELMGGTIGVKSEQGKGSTFWFTVVFKKEYPQEERPAPALSLDGRRVAVVDESDVDREALRQYLIEWGCDFEGFGSPHEALMRIREQSDAATPFDVVILKVQLSGMSGLQMVRLLHAEARLEQTKVIVITPAGQRGDAAKMNRIGVAGYLTMPLKHHQVVSSLQVVLGMKEVAPDSPHHMVTRHSLKERNNKKRMKILVVEDNKVNQKVIAKILEKIGHQCDIAENGMEAVEAHASHVYDLVFMDCQMPILSGYDATRAIRSEEKKKDRRRTPVVAMTANAMQGDREKCLEAGMDDYIPKPVNKETVAAMVEKWWDLHNDKAVSPDERPESES